MKKKPTILDTYPKLLENFGFEFTKKKHLPPDESPGTSFVIPDADDGSAVVEAGGAYGTYIDLDGAVRNEYELITRYREMANYPEVDSAVDDIVNEAIVADEDEPPVSIILDDIPEISAALQDNIREEFENICRLLDFGNNCYEIFRRWYIDGRLYYHKIIDSSRPQHGIQDLRYIDPRQIKKVKRVERRPGVTSSSRGNPGTPVDLIQSIEEYYLYHQRGVISVQANVGVKINLDAIAYVHSGVTDRRNMMVLSHLHKAVKCVNQLKMIEDAMVIYRLSRAPERRVFYIDVGNLPRAKAEQYIQNLMAMYRGKMVYDPTTGETRSDKQYLSMMEDYWLPRREGSTGTSIDTLRGAENLGQIQDVEYFKQKVYKSLNVPVTRLDSTQGFTLGRATEITRDEVKFSKFIIRLRKRFSLLFNDLLKTQLKLKNIVNEDTWNEWEQYIRYDFKTDSYFAELKDSEVMRERLSLASQIQSSGFAGKYYSDRYIRTNILKQAEDEIEDIDSEIDEEKAKYQADQQDGSGDTNDSSFGGFNQPKKAIKGVAKTPKNIDQAELSSADDKEVKSDNKGNI